MDELMLLQQVLQRAMVERLIDRSVETCANFWLLAVADGFEQEVAQRPSLEFELAEHVKYLTTQGLPRLF